MAQASTVTFDVGANFFGQGDSPMVMAYLNCNAGLPLEQEFEVGGPTRVVFTVTEFVPGSCEVTFGPAPAGFETDGADINQSYDATATSCLFDDGTNGTVVGAANTCTMRYAPAPVDFSVTVDWEISDDADEGVGDMAEVVLECFGDDDTSTTLPAGPDATMPVVLADVVPPATCHASIENVGSAVEIDDSDCLDVDLELGDGTVSCTITATAFYEGIPTLSQYGMAIMVLLMLGVGFVGFRRFV